ncbi:DUF5683 domain-containing protein [Myroides injenensis]|uniref:DUF5683 domain-containing protein n=1 Tax=Myroides injenensis TaxID=1183151 RepID=UPI0022702E52|nr:DUF5683 domain-containing protein [Myroides injenensis]
MKSKLLIIVFFFGALGQTCFAQEKEDEKKSESTKVESDYKPLDPLAPARAAFYTSIVPGLGQIYNKKYWKLPLVYAGIGIPAYFWADNQRNYTRYRNEYKKRLRGIYDESDPTFGGLDNERLLDGQNFYRRNRDLSVVITVGFYILSIVDANVDAHLSQFNVNEKLTIKPVFELNNPLDYQNQFQYAINIQYKF